MQTYTVTVFESAEEFFDKFDPKSQTYLVLAEKYPHFSGPSCHQFKFSDSVTIDQLIGEAFKRAGFRVHLT